jgi:hypothetical protein
MKTKLIGTIICILLLTIPVLSTASTEPKGAVLELEIFGGLSAGAKLRNIGDTDALFVFYNISINGGFLKPINYTITGGLGTLPQHNGAVDLVITFPSSVIQGFGKATITATADSLTTSPITTQADALVLFFFVLILR